MQIFAFPSGDPAEMAALSDADRQSLSGTTADFQSKAGYQKIQQTRPQTLGYGLTDSPAGQLAWNAELWTGWGDYADYLDVDTFLTHVSIYWFTRTAGSSARHYYEDAHSGAGYRDAPNKIPDRGRGVPAGLPDRSGPSRSGPTTSSATPNSTAAATSPTPPTRISSSRTCASSSLASA